jgi:hypothetical protein
MTPAYYKELVGTLLRCALRSRCQHCWGVVGGALVVLSGALIVFGAASGSLPPPQMNMDGTAPEVCWRMVASDYHLSWLWWIDADNSQQPVDSTSKAVVCWWNPTRH